MSEAEEQDTNQAFREALEEIRQSDDCLLFSPGPDFALACSCDDCRLKITKLKEFEDEFKSKRKLSRDYIGQLEKAEALCVRLVNTAKWILDMLNSLFRQLESLSESGESFSLEKDPSAAKMVVLFLQFVQLLKDNELLDSSEVPVYENEYNITLGIAAGIYYWKETKAKNEASPLLQEFSKIEEKKRKLAEEMGKSLDASICKGYIQDQIELVKRFPIEKLYAEADELIHKVCPIYEKKRMVGEIKVYIAKTSRTIIRERKGFWRRFQEHPYSEEAARKGQSNTHVSNGLHKTLDLLINMVDVFKPVEKGVRAFLYSLRP